MYRQVTRVNIETSFQTPSKNTPNAQQSVSSLKLDVGELTFLKNPVMLDAVLIPNIEHVGWQGGGY